MQQALDVQTSLLPYALVLFGVALPVYAWASSYAADRVWISASLAIFAINWAVFYVAMDWLRTDPARMANVGLRVRMHILGGLLWAVAVAQVAIIGDSAGMARESILLMATGAAAICVFFSAPLLPALLIVGPAASAPPILLLLADPASRSQGRIAMGAIALAMALSLIMNRLLRRLFAFAAERESLIEERAQSLAHAEKLAKSKSDLLATLSHEIRNGLTGAAHVLAAAAGAGGRTAPSREQLTAALGATEDLLGVLDTTLDVESAGSGRLSLAPQPIDLPRLAQDMVLQQRPLAAAKGLELSVHVDEDLAAASLAGGGLGAVIADPTRVRQILANLLGNAIKYTIRGRIEVRVSRLAHDRVRLEVVDTGPGLTPDELARAFEPFERIHRTAAGVPGAGLGLSLARQLAGLMNGTISVEGAPGVGCCFRLELPYERTARVAERTDAQTSPGMVQALRVLVAVDDALQAAMLRAVLEQLGHHVLQAHDGRRACELAQICDVDLFMIEARLSGMDGPQTVRAIRGLDVPAANAPIIAIIGGDADEAGACLDAGADHALRTPVTVASVARALAGAVREDRAAPARLVVNR